MSTGDVHDIETNPKIISTTRKSNIWAHTVSLIIQNHSCLGTLENRSVTDDQEVQYIT